MREGERMKESEKKLLQSGHNFTTHNLSVLCPLLTAQLRLSLITKFPLFSFLFFLPAIFFISLLMKFTVMSLLLLHSLHKL